MKTKRIFRAGWLVLGVVTLLTFSAVQAQAAVATSGEVVNQMAALCNMNPADLTAILFPAGEWNMGATANEASLALLYLAVDTALKNGTLKCTVPNLVSTAAAKSGVDGETVKSGISYGSTISATSSPRGPAGGMLPGGFGPGGFGPGGAGAGGGGGVGTQSR